MTNPSDKSMLDYDYIVIGSGFGGSVSALRLTEKGYRVGVLEMGKRYRTEDFPPSNWRLWKFLWLPSLKFHGIQKVSLFKDLLIFHGVGVGGGSLVYANTLPVPPDMVFGDPNWPGQHDWKERLKSHYDTAETMLGATEARETFEADHLLRDVVDRDLGRGNTFQKHNVGVYYGEPDQTVEDPYFNGDGPPRTGCTHCGECMTGCKRNAKNTLDKNYLFLAEKKGCQIHAETLVTDVIPVPGGGYEIHTRSSTKRSRKYNRVFRAKGVVFSAGPLGTVKLLLQNKLRGNLPGLSVMAGRQVRTNSEALLGVSAKNFKIDYSKGLAITSGVFPDDDTHIEIVRYGKGHNAMALLNTYLTGGGKPWPRWLRWIGNMFRHPLGFLFTTVKWRWARRSVILLVMQTKSNHLRMTLKKKMGRTVLASRLEEGQTVPTFIPLANEVTRRLAKKMNGVPQSLLLEVLLNTSSTAHILGGAIMGDSPEHGVCDEDGKVFGYKNMYVADGSLVPANLGVNPALTITALSEYVMSRIPEKG